MLKNGVTYLLYIKRINNGVCFLIYKLKDLLITIAMNNTIHVNLSKVVLIVIMGLLKYIIKNKLAELRYAIWQDTVKLDLQCHNALV